METPPARDKNKERSQEDSHLGSFYRLRSLRRCNENNYRVEEGPADQNCGRNTIYATPVRSSRRLNSSEKCRKEERKSLDISSPKEEGSKIMITPNPFIKDEAVQELLSDLFNKYKDKVQIINFRKQPQLIYQDTESEIANLEEDFGSKLQIHDNPEETPKPDKNAKFKQKHLEETQPSTESASQKKEYLFCKSRQKKRIIGSGTALAQPLPHQIKTIAENDYWIVVELPKNSDLFKKHGSSRVLTQKRILGNPVNHPPSIQSIQEYKALHAELKQLLELSNYCYSPDLF